MGPSDNTSVKGTFKDDRAMKGKFSALFALAFPVEVLQGFLYFACFLSQRCQRSWIKLKEIYKNVRPNRYVRCLQVSRVALLRFLEERNWQVTELLAMVRKLLF